MSLPNHQFIDQKTKWLGHRLHYYSQVVSTNHIATELAKKHASAGTVVLADQQTGGEGRMGRRWMSGDGGLWFSVILKPNIQLENTPPITLMASVAIAEAIEKSTQLKPGIKWPNDLLINGRKVCGILTEIVMGEADSFSVVVGIGINVNISKEAFGQELNLTATSLLVELKREVERDEFFYKTLYQLEKWYTIWQEEGFQPIKDAWKKHNITLGNHVKISSCDEIIYGQALDMDNHGALLVKGSNGEIRRFNHGEVSLRTI